MSGFISIQRSIKDHWLWDDAVKFKWWISILMSCNYADAKVLIKGSLIESRRGQCVKSLETWAQEWRTTKKTVHSFFKLLESDKIIETENMRVTTRITVCNYDVYQKFGNAEGTESKRKVNAAETQSKRSLPPTNNNNKENKENKREAASAASSPELQLRFERMEKWISENAPTVSQMKEPLNAKQLESLLEKYSSDQIADILRKMHNRADLLKKNRSAHLTMLNWLSREHTTHKTSALEHNLTEVERAKILRRQSNTGYEPNN